MKKTLIAFRWFFASLIVGLVILGILIISGLYVPPDTEVTSEGVSRKALYTGLTIWIFLIGTPLLALILGIRGRLPGTQSRKSLVQT
jgi:hypothetical protein